MDLFYKVPLYEEEICDPNLPPLAQSLDERIITNIVVYKGLFGTVKEVVTGIKIDVIDKEYDFKKGNYIKKKDLNKYNKIDMDGVCDYIETFDLKTCPFITKDNKIGAIKKKKIGGIHEQFRTGKN